MANTEGMSDEKMVSLLTPSTTTTTSRKKSTFALRQERLRQRMEEPMGERPAATVIRASPPSIHTRTNNTNNNDSDGIIKEEGDSKREAAAETKTPANNSTALPPVLGAVMERNVVPRHYATASSSSSSSTSTRTKSRFASQRQRNGDNNTGFPSVHMPIGTFVANKHKNIAAASTSTSASAAVPTEQQENQGLAQTRVLSSQQDDSIQRDSEALLAQMSPDEIRDEVQELKATLSPEMISFLQQRAQQKTNKKTTGNARDVFTTTTTKGTNVTNDRDTSRKQQTPVYSHDNKNDDDVQEKQRVASLLSSIKSPEELDAVYAKETGIIPAPEEDGGEEPVEDDWNTACILLRSTSPRQKLWAARVVCQGLEVDLAAEKSFPIGSSWPYPVVLVVSLRCLLDSPVSKSNGFLLHTYVLRSLYALLRLRAHSDHIVDVSCQVGTAASVFQEYFLQDAVPSPPFGTCYPSISVQPVASTQDGNAVAYSTSSSSTSAQQDGEAFCKDPMWTLLTRMRILPRLAELLSVTPRLPDEAIVATCGILSMLSVRSVGTASAIAQNSTLLSSLLEVTLLPQAEHRDCDSQSCPGFFNTRVALPIVVLLCTLARQSRIGAAAIPIDSIVPAIVAMKAETDDELKLQQCSLVLWRTVLRYGLGLSSLSTLISLSIPHLASGRASKHSLGAEFLSAFSNVCYCVRIVKSKPVAEWNRVMSEENGEVLATAQDWLATTARQTISHVKDIYSLFSKLDMRLAAARLLFLQSYFDAYEQGSSEERKDAEDDDGVAWHELVDAIKHLSKRDTVKRALSLVQSTLVVSNSCADVLPIPEEASACAFVGALASLLDTLSKSECRRLTDTRSREVLTTAMSRFERTFLDWLIVPTTAISISTASSPSFPRARLGWLNTTNFHVSKVTLATTMSSSESPARSFDLDIVRAHAYSLIGRLQLGEEAFAAILFSNDALFRTSKQSPLSASALSSFLMQELCATPRSRQQLDHSFKLHYGFGITANEWGPFQIGTLLSETDSQEARSSSGPFAELLLPLGHLWLWKILSGIMNQAQAEETVSAEQDPNDETKILSECLEILLHLESTESTEVLNFYAAQVPDGAKLYYLMNVLLHSERVLRDDRISELVTALFDCYTAQLQHKGTTSRTAPITEHFWRECLNHSQVSSAKQLSDSSNKMDPKDEELLSMLMGPHGISEKKLRPLIDFVSDVAKAYLEYGAQYDAFTRCIRLFLSTGFPPQVRCEAIRSLRDVLHLLTLPVEEANPHGSEMEGALNMCLLGGDVNESDSSAALILRDSFDFLDLLVCVLSEGGSDQASTLRWNVTSVGFFYLFAVASLARSQAAASIQDGASEENLRKRLAPLSKEIAEVVLETAARLQEGNSGGQSDKVVSTVLDVVRAYQ